MALPPKDDDSSATETKSRRPRARASAKTAEEKPAKAAKPAARSRARRGPAAKPEAADSPAPVMETRPPEPAPRDEMPARVEAPPPPPPEPRDYRSPEPRTESASSAPIASSDSAPAPEDRAVFSASPSDSPGQSDQFSHQQPQGGGQWQGHQGGQDRGGFWKKRKRGRHGGGGHWQQGGGGGGPGGGHGGREQHPAQLPPPSNAPVFGDLPNPSRFNDLAALDALANDLAGGSGAPIFLHEIYAKTLQELVAYARGLGVKFEGAPGRLFLLGEILKFAAAEKRPVRDTGYIDQNDRGCFIVHRHVNYRLYPEDAYLPDSLVKRYGLKRGHLVECVVQPPLEGERCPSIVRIESVMGLAPERIASVTPFEELVPYYPLKRILLEDPAVVKDMSMRAVDILTPIGFGQRGLIVAPPRTGKTILLQNIANSITANSPDVKLILLLIDERPEEVTDFKRHTKGEVVSSTFDETPESHVHCAEMVIEIARRRIEQGEHVVILLDSITRLARAYNALAGNGGKTMSGGLESNALQKPKRFFGSARNIEGGGSLTIIASALIDTGSRMDEIIFEEFKGTGNSELHLDRGLVERRIFPAINIDRSGTRKEELLYHPDELQRIFALRRAMQGLGPIESMEMLITRLKKTKSNTEFLLSLAPK